MALEVEFFSPTLCKAIREESKIKFKTIPMEREIEVKIPPQSVALIVICPEPLDTLPDQPYNINVMSEEGSNDILITWRYNGHVECLKGFQVEFSVEYETGYQILNEGSEEIVNLYQHQNYHNLNVWYRISAVDLWGRRGPYSIPRKV